MQAPRSQSSGWSPPDGSYPAICITIVDCGVHERNNYMAAGTKMVHELYLRFQMPEILLPETEGEYAGLPAEVGMRMTFSMYKLAKLRQHLQTWRGRPFSDEEAEQFQIDSVLGKPAILQLYTNDKGYLNINLITPYQGPQITHRGELTLFDTMSPDNLGKLPEWLQRKIVLPSEESLELNKAYADEQTNTHSALDDEWREKVPEDEFDDDIPF